MRSYPVKDEVPIARDVFVFFKRNDDWTWVSAEDSVPERTPEIANLTAHHRHEWCADGVL